MSEKKILKIELSEQDKFYGKIVGEFNRWIKENIIPRIQELEKIFEIIPRLKDKEIEKLIDYSQWLFDDGFANFKKEDIEEFNRIKSKWNKKEDLKCQKKKQ